MGSENNSILITRQKPSYPARGYASGSLRFTLIEIKGSDHSRFNIQAGVCKGNGNPTKVCPRQASLGINSTVECGGVGNQVLIKGKPAEAIVRGYSLPQQFDNCNCAPDYVGSINPHVQIIDV